MRRRVQVAQNMWKLMGVTRDDAAGRVRALMENYRFWGAPVGMIVTVDRSLHAFLGLMSFHITL